MAELRALVARIQSPPMQPRAHALALLAAAACLLPLLLQLPLQLGIGFGIAALVIAFASWRRPLPFLLRLLVGIGMIVAIAVVPPGVGRDTACMVLAAMLALKPSETASLRDGRSLVGFGLFAPFAAFLLDQDLLSMALALVALVGGSILKGAGLSSLWSSAAFVIVIVGTVAAIFVHTPPTVFKRALRIVGWILKPPAADREALMAQILEWSNIARRQGLLGLEQQVAEQDDAFLKKGLQMLVDGVEPEQIRHMLEIDLDSQEHQDLAAAKVFEGMGIYAPTLGIIGAVFGLIAVMKNLADPSKLGHGIAAAFTATIYGIASANLFFLPMASKLKSVIARRTGEREMIIEGLIAIAQGENPRNIESKLAGFLH